MELLLRDYPVEFRKVGINLRVSVQKSNRIVQERVARRVTEVLVEEAGALDAVARPAAAWFSRHWR